MNGLCSTGLFLTKALRLVKHKLHTGALAVKTPGFRGSPCSHCQDGLKYQASPHGEVSYDDVRVLQSSVPQLELPTQDYALIDRLFLRARLKEVWALASPRHAPSVDDLPATCVRPLLDSSFRGSRLPPPSLPSLAPSFHHFALKLSTHLFSCWLIADRSALGFSLIELLESAMLFQVT